jgi:hypothetical protein
MGGIHATCETPWLFVWSCLIVFMIPIYDLSSFENTYRSSTQRSLLTCRLVTCLKYPIVFGCISLRKVLDAFSLQLLMIMLGHLDKVNLTWYTWMVEDVERVLVGMNWDYSEQTNLVTHRKWPLLSLITLGGPSLLGYFIWRVKKFLDPHNKGLT